MTICYQCGGAITPEEMRFAATDAVDGVEFMLHWRCYGHYLAEVYKNREAT